MSLDDRSLQGFDELYKNLGLLEAATEAKILRQAAGQALSPTVKKLKEAAPKGNEAHRTYKGRLVAPGFLSRSIKKKTFVNKKTGSVHAVIGLVKEAWYGLLYDTGFRRGKQSKSMKRDVKRGGSDTRTEVAGTNWFREQFINDRDGIEARFAKHIQKPIDKITVK